MSRLGCWKGDCIPAVERQSTVDSVWRLLLPEGCSASLHLSAWSAQLSVAGTVPDGNATAAPRMHYRKGDFL